MSVRSLTLGVAAAVSVSAIWGWAALLVWVWLLPNLGHGRQGLDALAEFALDVAVLLLLSLVCLAVGALCVARYVKRRLVIITGATLGLLVSVAFVVRPLVGWLVGCQLLIGDTELTASWMSGNEVGTMKVKDLPIGCPDVEIYCFTQLDHWCKGTVVLAQILCTAVGATVPLAVRHALFVRSRRGSGVHA